jgi:glycosyltransferase involved in cell wall biosynthesis
MNAIDCLVHPQIGTEALPGVVAEAHACGKPVITTHLDAFPRRSGSVTMTRS